MNDGCSATSKSNHIKKDEKIEKFIDFHDSRARLSTMAIDYEKFFRLSTFKNFIDFRLSTRARGGLERKKPRSFDGFGVLF